ncbi:OPT family oligopeptide transporter [Zongyangia hominis]|uniref:Oligopeptide transporter, OPT family n=1 Tax=Zongyangia hominis TaxID=2763677 RepID=A0A926ICE7_9FIRM|nr:oligopeptide transporter, OPT family [Zongyangia hominis]MBC8571142.1 oligopeptide transporter, OPT family [Zongyangia hominis]
MENPKSSFKPFVPADKVMPEFTATSIILGIILAVVFGAANAYLGLRVGLTVSASIPAAVISMGVIRVIMRKDSILENNMVQTIGSAGESLAAGAIFTLPALFMWMQEWGEGSPSLITITIIALCGGVLGIMFMIPLRKAIIVKEHGVLPFPEGQACAEVLLAGEEGGSKASTVFAGLGIAAAYKLITDGFKLFPSEVHYEITPYKGAGIGVDVLPALLGVGYICGPKISSYMFAGGIVSWLVLMPMISLFGGDMVMFPATVPISTMGSSDLWGSYIRYIGAGAVAMGGIMSLVKSLPMIGDTFKHAMKGLKASKGDAKSNLRTDSDIPMQVILIVVLIVALIIWLLPAIPVNIIGALIIVIFGFFFATVSSRLVGLVGSSNNPVSGMTIATLLIATLILKATGMVGHDGMTGAITIGAVICIIAAIAGDTSQDLSTGYIVGATPKKQQYGELIGVVAAAIAIGGVLYLLNAAWGFSGTELPAPQAMLAKMVVEGVMNANLPWTLVIAGAGIAVVVQILGIPVLPFAVGLYLPFHLNAGIMVGGIIRWFFERKKTKNEAEEHHKKEIISRGILYTSGMIAGEGIIGILLAVFAVIPMGAIGSFGDFINLGRIFPGFTLGNIGGLLFFALLILIMLKFTLWHKDKKKAE